MKALLLAAGFGRRLGRLTRYKPKCLMTVGDQPMLDHWIYKLERLSVTEFIVNTHYLADKVDDFISTHPLRKKITISFEPELLGTANTLLNHLDVLKQQDCFVVHVDNYCADPLDKMVVRFKRRPSHCVSTMLLFQTDRPQECGIVEFDETHTMTGFYEKVSAPPSDMANGAVYLFSATFLQQLSQKSLQLNDISYDIIPLLLGKMNCYFTPYYFQDIGNPDALDQANRWNADALSK